MVPIAARHMKKRGHLMSATIRPRDHQSPSMKASLLKIKNARSAPRLPRGFLQRLRNRRNLCALAADVAFRHHGCCNCLPARSPDALRARRRPTVACNLPRSLYWGRRQRQWMFIFWLPLALGLLGIHARGPRRAWRGVQPLRGMDRESSRRWRVCRLPMT